MEHPIYIIGHKNPDADSICAPIAYEHLKHRLNQKHYIAARCGNVNARIQTILDYFNVPLPEFLGDVTPRVHDIMVPLDQIHQVKPTSTYAEALELIDTHDIRALPVVNEQGQIQGMVNVFQLGEYFIPNATQHLEMRYVRTTLQSIQKALRAKVVHLVNQDLEEEFYIRVGAMSFDVFVENSEKADPSRRSILIVGNRKNIISKAIDYGLRLIVISGGFTFDEELLNRAKEKGVSIIESEHDIAATTWLIRSAAPIANIVKKNITTFRTDETLAYVSKRISSVSGSIYFVTDEDNKLQGVFTKSDLLKPSKVRLALVDHNELSQAVTGADEVAIVEIIDHHRLGNPPTHAPIRFINEPWGSSSTIIANMFRIHGIDPDPNIAGILMGGMITDTLNLNSPTTTDVDREILPWLGNIAGISPDNLAEIIFNSGSIILNATPEDIIESDCKIFKENDVRFSVSQIEELGLTNFWNHSHELLEALENYRSKENLEFSLLLVTDINTQNSLLLVQGNDDFTKMIKYPQVESNPIFELQGVVSRKKQLMPYVTSLINSPESTFN